MSENLMNPCLIRVSGVRSLSCMIKFLTTHLDFKKEYYGKEDKSIDGGGKSFSS